MDALADVSPGRIGLHASGVTIVHPAGTSPSETVAYDGLGKLSQVPPTGFVPVHERYADLSVLPAGVAISQFGAITTSICPIQGTTKERRIRKEKNRKQLPLVFISARLSQMFLWNAAKATTSAGSLP
jgi:hypothetical protein